jgi:uncharacterized membrane protein
MATRAQQATNNRAVLWTAVMLELGVGLLDEIVCHQQLHGTTFMFMPISMAYFLRWRISFLTTVLLFSFPAALGYAAAF